MLFIQIDKYLMFFLPIVFFFVKGAAFFDTKTAPYYIYLGKGYFITTLRPLMM